MAGITRPARSTSLAEVRRLIAAGFALLLTTLPPCAYASAASLERGNAAVKAGQYEQALGWYDREAAAGNNSALLSFNRGVAEYRLGRYAAAEVSFTRASVEPKLARRAAFSLGLVSKAMGRRADARAWFRQCASARDTPPALRRLADEQIAALGQPAARVSSASSLTQYSPERPVDFFDLAVSTQVAMDSNIYRAPSSPYADLSRPGNPIVVPEVQSGTYTPIQAFGSVKWGRRDYSRFFARYAFDGDVYTDSRFSNANRYSNAFEVGNVYDRERPFGRIYLASSFTVARYDEEAYNHDDGTDQVVNGQDVSDRYRYVHTGPRIRFAHDVGRLRYGWRLAGFADRYDATIATLDYSSYQVLGGVDVSYRIFDGTRVGLNFDAADRNYETYPARELDGTRTLTSPSLEYRYLSGGANLRQRVTSALWVTIDYQYTDRADQYVGYEDYRRHSIRLQAHVDMGRFAAGASYLYRDYTFANAFAFDRPAGGALTLTTHDAVFDASMRLWRDVYLTANATLDVRRSSDPESAYDRTQAALGVRWTM